MPPVMDRKSSNQRCEKAWKLRIAGRSWQEVADAVGYKSRQSAQKAVESWLAKNPPDDLETARRANGDGIRMVRSMLLRSMTAADREGDYQATGTLGRAILDSYEREAKLWGLHVVLPTQVDVNVRTAVAVLERAEAELLAIAEAQPAGLPVLEAEIVESGT